MSKITAIQEIKGYSEGDKWLSYDGYKVVTESDTIFVLIENGQHCCEDWGYLSSNEDLSYFVGSDLLKVAIVDQKLDVIEMEDLYEGDAVFVNFETSLGVFQLAVYNSHNGYYGHDVLILAKELDERFTV